jgi:hypothetical protein
LVPVVLLAPHVWLVNMPVLLVQLLHLKRLKALVLLPAQLVVSAKLLPVLLPGRLLMSSTVALVKRQRQLLVFPLPQVLLVSAV